MRLRPRLSAVLMLVNFAVIALPLGSIFFFRIYENQLIQETERELISQAAVIAAAYQTAVRFVEASPSQQQVQQEVPEGSAKARSLKAPLNLLTNQSSVWSPITPQLDLAKVDTLPERPDGVEPPEPSTALAVSAGRALSPILKRAQRTSLVGVRVLDEKGTTVGGTAEVGLNFLHVPEVARALRGEYASALRYRELENAPSEYDILSTISRGTKVRVFVAFPVIDNNQVLGAVYLSRTPKSVLRHMYEEREKVVLALLTVLFLAISLAWLTSRTISRPVAQLLERTGKIARGESTTMAPLEHPGTREMAELSDGIGRMASALVDRAAYIRTLANHVSHEFKTPLASIQGAAELLQDHHDAMSPEERQRFLENISKDGERLKALLDRLLELARAENAVSTEERVQLRPLAERAMGGLPSGVSGHIEIEETVSARITDEAMTIVLSNLVDNAVQHGATEIDLNAAPVSGHIMLTVRDNGAGVTAANREKIFEHFFTTRRENGGTGLGLGIVQALLTAHGGRIELAPTEAGHGTTFKLSLSV